MKRCEPCGIDLPLEEFAVKDSKSGRLLALCRRHQREYNRRYYAAHPARQLANVAAQKKRNAERLRALKAGPCADCGVSYPYWVMDFDHREDATKVAGLNSMAARSSWGAIKSEISKCDLVCANCHRERTHRRTLAE